MPSLRHSLILASLPLSVAVLAVLVTLNMDLSGREPEPAVPTSPGAGETVQLQSMAEAGGEESGLASPDPERLPESAASFLSNFYAAYRERDRERLAFLFTRPGTEGEQEQYARLFIPREGEAAGSLLFEAPAAQESVRDYVLLGASLEEGRWTVTVKETRVSAEGTGRGEKTALLTLVQGLSEQGPWLIDSYHAAGSGGKYSGFLVE